MPAHLKFETDLWNQGFCTIAGLDEVGRGALCGPVIAAAVVLSPEHQIAGIDDSKKLTIQKRERLFQDISRSAIAIGIGCASASEIDSINILNATRLAMRRALGRLRILPDYLLIDAVRLHGIDLPSRSLIKGDEQSQSIAAASIIAKVTRDKAMRAFGRHYRGYGMEKNMGYGTPQHLDALTRLGPSKIHRMSFRPIFKIPELFT